MLRHITLQQVRDLGVVPYHYIDFEWKLTLENIANWSDEVEMKIYYTPEFLYFETSEDRLNFRLRWC